MIAKIAYSKLIFNPEQVSNLKDHFKGAVKFVDIENVDFLKNKTDFFSAFVDLRTAKNLSKKMDLRLQNEHIYDYGYQAYAFGEERFLNYDFLIIPAFHMEKALDFFGGSFFCKPVKLVKTFGGFVVRDSTDITPILKLTGTEPDDKVIISKVKDIIPGSEIRFFISREKIVDCSPLPSPLGGTKSIEDGTAIEFAKKVIPKSDCLDGRLNLANLSEYVLDICQTSEGFKVVEINCYHTAGIYDCDPVKVVSEILKYHPDYSQILKKVRE